MRQRRWRLGVRAQLTLVVLLGALLSTAATLFIANNAIQQYALQQAHTQEQHNLDIAMLVLQTQYGQNISISSDGQLVADSPSTSTDLSLYTQSNYGKYPLNNDTSFVDQVHALIGGFVSIYQCANAQGELGQCVRISTTLHVTQGQSTGTNPRDTGAKLESVPASKMALNSASPQTFLGEVDYEGLQYYTDYTPLFNPQHKLIGVLAVGVPLESVTAFQRATTLQLLLLGLIVMIAGIIFALLLASTIVATLQTVARQVSSASERIGAIATQQVGGAEQQVWAVNSINKALQTFAATTREISQRTDQLAQMGNQVIQRRADIMPQQIDSILAYITRSVRDISVASRQEAQQYERMTGAMQAVMEIAEQVSTGSQQATESARRLDEVVVELQQIVGMRGFPAAPKGAGAEAFDPMTEAAMTGAGMPPMSQPAMGSMGTMGALGGRPAQMGQMGQMGQMTPMGQMGQMGPMGARGDRNARMGGGFMGRMPDTAASLGGLPAGAMSGPMAGPSSGMLRPNVPSGQIGRQIGAFGTDGQLPPLGPTDAGDVRGFAGRTSFGGDGRGDGEFGSAMPPLPSFPGGAGGMMGPSRPDMSAPPVGRTRGFRGPISGQQGSTGQNSSASTNASMPNWMADRGDGSR